MSDFPEYSFHGKIGLAVINSDWASAVFYCEDELHEAFYDRLIKRIVPEIKPYYVVCMGGKSEVLKVAKSDDQIPSVVEICIVDKDYDDILGEVKKVKFDKLIYLQRHSIENYLPQKEALINIAVECRAKEYLSKKDIENLMSDFEIFNTKLIEALVEIGRYFVVARKNRINIQTSKMPCDDIYTNVEEIFPVPNQDWFDSYKEKFLDTCNIKHDWLTDPITLSSNLAAAFLNVNPLQTQLPAADHVVGKHLLGGFLRYINSRFNINLLEIDPVELYTRLASHISISDLLYLRAEILRIEPKLA